jgi:ABC-2 type transport system permease protein
MGSVAGEEDRGTAAFILVKPAGRLAFLAAKLIAIALILGLGVVLGVAGAALYTAVLFEPLDPAGWAGLAGTLWLSLAAYAAITFLGSTLTRSVAGGAAIGVGGLIGLAILSALPNVAPFLPGGLAELGGKLVLGHAAADLPGSLAVSIALIVGAAAAASLVFRRREL